MGVLSVPDLPDVVCPSLADVVSEPFPEALPELLLLRSGSCLIL